MRVVAAIYVLETASAHLRELLREACSKLAPTQVFASITSARQALAAAPPSVFIVGGAPLEAAASDALREAVQRGIPSFACVHATELRAVLLLGVQDGCERTEASIETLTTKLAGFLSSRQRLPTSLRAQPVPMSIPSPHSPMPRTPARGHHLIAIGASTGGPEAISELLSILPVQLPGIVIVQHMPGSQTGAFAHRLDQESAWKVREARDGDRIERGVALVAPGGQHIRLQTAGLCLSVSPQGAPTRHVPSVDVFFDSVARELGGHAIGVLLTGMGDDGAQGMAAMRRTGALTFAQSAATCAVFGMPRRAIELDAACEVVAVSELPERLRVHGV